MTQKVCVEIEYEGKVRRSKPMWFKTALKIWAQSAALPCRITPVNSRRPLWPANDEEARVLRDRYQAEEL